MSKSTLIAVLSCLSILLFVHCKKGSDSTFVPNKFTYQLNGQTFSDPNDGAPILDNDYHVRGIMFRNTAALNDFIFFYNSPASCAFMLLGIPYSLSLDCKLNFLGPVDSSKIYLYRSGALNYSFSNCRHKKAYDPGPGGVGRFEYDECAVNGTFSLTLANNNNETIEITNGSFTFYPVRK